MHYSLCKIKHYLFEEFIKNIDITQLVFVNE